MVTKHSSTENSEQTFEDVVEASYSLRFYIPHSSTMCAASSRPFGRPLTVDFSYQSEKVERVLLVRPVDNNQS
jgi:hypothetical protein